MLGTGLLQLSRALHRVSDLSEMMQCVRSVCAKYTRYDRVFIQAISPDKKSFEVIGYTLADTEMVRIQVAAIELDKDQFLQNILATTEPFVVPDMRLDPLADQIQVAKFGLRTLIVVPMLDGDDKLGPLIIATYADQGVVLPTNNELDFFTQVGSLVSVVITRLRAEKAREELEEKLLSTRKLEALGRMAGEVAHDFNNLLLIIRGNTELATGELQDHAALPYLTMIRDATIRASSLSRQLLAFSKGQVLTPQVLDLNSLVENNLKLIRRLMPSNIELHETFSTQACMVNADASQIDQVIMNLVMNARDSLRDNGRIQVATQIACIDEEFTANHTKVSPGRYVLLTITDNGHGMDMETQSKIFEPFFTTKSPDKGTGLGLAVVQGVVGQHHGHIHVSSEVNVGTTFKVYLPVCEQRIPDVDSLSPAQSTDLQSDKLILVVDDQENIRTTVSTVLERAGYQVHVANNTQTALGVLAKSKVDLLLTDIVMSGENGLVLADKATQSYPSLQILLMTGYAPTQVGEISWAHITKPFTPTELLLQIRSLLSKRQ